ncbi:MAG TPA: DUF190 domain-containing protein [Acidimicrobiales bacterium]|nr:DUF190 domain-containing protein [Acidimicrobiales bacterium]
MSPFPTHPARRLTVFLHSRDHVGHHTLVVELLRRARHIGVHGATVVRAGSGFGHSGHRHATHVFAEDAPETLVVVDRADLVDAFARDVAVLAPDALVVVHDVDVVEL